MKVRAAFLEGIGKVKVVDRRVDIGDTGVLVKTHASSICLADVQIYRKGYYAEGKPLPLPLYPGHEGGGVVEAVGSRVHEFEPGNRVMLSAAAGWAPAGWPSIL